MNGNIKRYIYIIVTICIVFLVGAIFIRILPWLLLAGSIAYMVTKIVGLIKEKKQQKDIAKILKLSTAKVTRLLQKAFDLEIIKFNIADSNLGITKLESEIEKKFGLRRMLIVKSNEENGSKTKTLIGQKISNYLLNILKDRSIR